MNEPSLDQLLAVARPVGRAFAAAGHRVYLVGGVVRDHLLGGAVDEAADLDLTTDALPEAIQEVVGPLADAVWTQGERFGTIGCRIDGRMYEITTHRAERYDLDSRKPDVEFSTSVTDDLSRRDFTINAMARELPGGELIDPFDGAADLQRGRLMTPIEPHLSFTDDPLRMLRAARFVASYDVQLDPSVEAVVGELADRLDIVSMERIRGELERLLCAPDPTAGLELLLRTGLAERFLPELAVADLDAVAAAAPDPVLRLAVVLAPDGADGARRRLRELRFANDTIASVGRIVAAVEALDDLGDESLRRFVVTSRPDTDRAVQLAAALGRPDALAPSLAELRAREGDDFDPPVTGGDLIDELGLEPGPLVGRAVAWLAEARLLRGPMSRSEAVAAAREWLADQPVE